MLQEELFLPHKKKLKLALFHKGKPGTGPELEPGPEAEPQVPKALLEAELKAEMPGLSAETEALDLPAEAKAGSPSVEQSVLDLLVEAKAEVLENSELPPDQIQPRIAQPEQPLLLHERALPEVPSGLVGQPAKHLPGNSPSKKNSKRQQNSQRAIEAIRPLQASNDTEHDLLLSSR